MLEGCDHQFVSRPPHNHLHCKFCNVPAPEVEPEATPESQPNPYMLIPPGGPSGPFWGVMRQSGLIIATQIQERDTAELLIAVLSIIDGDFDTVQAVAREYEKIWDSNPEPAQTAIRHKDADRLHSRFWYEVRKS